MYVEFQLSSYSSFRDIMRSQIYTGGAAPPRTPLAEKFSYPKKALGGI